MTKERKRKQHILCADCKYHQCKNTCIYGEGLCDGRCTKTNNHRNCSKSGCIRYEVDPFFIEGADIW